MEELCLDCQFVIPDHNRLFPLDRCPIKGTEVLINDLACRHFKPKTEKRYDNQKAQKASPQAKASPSIKTETAGQRGTPLPEFDGQGIS